MPAALNWAVASNLRQQPNGDKDRRDLPMTNTNTL